MIVITGGGTGGHLSIVKVIGVEYNKLGIRPMYIGSTNGQDKEWFENSPIFSKTIFLETKGVINQSFFGKFSSFFNIIKSSFKLKKLFKENDVTKVFSVGGYSSAPASIAAIIYKVPLFIHEQNAKIGRLNKLLKPFAKEFFSSYYKLSPVIDYPISNEWFLLAKERKNIKTILFLGGSQGASFINKLAMEIAPFLNEKKIKIVHQTGKNDFLNITKYYERLQIDVDVFDFFSPLYEKFKDVDFAISRAGAGCLWELCAARIPTLFIPFPHASQNHQFFNAKGLEESNAALLENQKEIDLVTLKNIILNLNINQMYKALDGFISPNGAQRIVNRVELYKKGKT